MTRKEAKHRVSSFIHSMLYIDEKDLKLQLKTIDDIYDDFESRTCENCKYLEKTINSKDNDKQEDWLNCDLVYVETRELYSLKNFGCNKWEAKDDTTR